MKKIITLVCFCVLTTLQAQEFNYAEALQKSLFFYEAQQSGKLPDWNRVSWRGDAMLNDKGENGEDLTGGWHDAGDHIKFGLPMAYSVSALNWAFLEYEEGYKKAGQVAIFKNNIKWVTDYFIKCHVAPNEFYAQVSDKATDHAKWVAAEVHDMLKPDRKAYKLSTTKRGTEVVCETAAAMASASIIFKDSDPAYSQELLVHAKQLFDFGNDYRGNYITDGGVAAGNTYPSGGYIDEIVWAAIWLYKATGDASYLQIAETEYDNSQPDYVWTFVWADKPYANMVMLAMLTDKQKYKTDSERHLDFLLPGGGINYSPGGQAHLTEWGSLRHSANGALTAFIYADKVATTKKQQYIDFAEKQINYILGDNPDNRSYVVGFGNNPPKNPHHRTGHGSWLDSDSGAPNPSSHTLYGALVGGPKYNTDGASYVDETDDYQANEIACDYNACFQGAVARMVEKYGGTALANFPPVETPTRKEIFANAKFNEKSERKITLAVDLSNHSAWPARALINPSFRYFIDISEAADAGYSIADYSARANYIEGSGTVSDFKVWDQAKNIYYVEVQFEDTFIIPGGNSHNAKEGQIAIEVNQGVPFDVDNDWSGKDIELNTFNVNDNIAIYDNGTLIAGVPPAGGTLSVDNFDKLGLTIFPNPAHSKFTISGSQKLQGATVKLISLTGTVIKSETIKNSEVYSMDVSAFATGLYMLTLETTSGLTLTERIALF